MTASTAPATEETLRWANEDELVHTFAQVMHEWGFRPFRRGEVALPTRLEALERLATSRYSEPGRACAQPAR